MKNYYLKHEKKTWDLTPEQHKMWLNVMNSDKETVQWQNQILSKRKCEILEKDENYYPQFVAIEDRSGNGRIINKKEQYHYRFISWISSKGKLYSELFGKEKDFVDFIGEDEVEEFYSQKTRYDIKEKRKEYFESYWSINEKTLLNKRIEKDVTINFLKKCSSMSEYNWK